MAWLDELRSLISSKWPIGEKFTLREINQYEAQLAQRHPDNENVQAKIRQTLQELRSEGFLEFVDNNGTYRRSTSPMDLRAALGRILAEYPVAKLAPFNGSHAIWTVFRGAEAALTSSQPVRDRVHLIVEAAAGKGNWSNIPWIALMDPAETTSVQQGVYCVYLFREDMSGVYLTFNQGVTALIKAEGLVSARKALRERAIQLRAYCTPAVSRGFDVATAIDLRSDGGLAKEYVSSTVAHKLYERDKLPSAEELRLDLDAALQSYDNYLAKEAVTEEAAVEPSPDDLSSVHRAWSAALTRGGISFGESHARMTRSFVAAVATKPFVILTGLSGSGKTQIGMKLGEWLGKDRLLVQPVRPDWTGAEYLFGYEDALLPIRDGERAWYVPKTLKFMLRAGSDPNHVYVLVLDEMNLAHVERYFADALSGMESRVGFIPNLAEGIDGYWRPATDGVEMLTWPQNLIVIGTVNIDETTYMFSPKVLDRANTFEFRVGADDLVLGPPPLALLESGPPKLSRALLDLIRDSNWQATHPAPYVESFARHLRELHRLLAIDGFEFGHRVFQEAVRFAAMLYAAGDSSLESALDLQVLQKMLPKLHGSRRRLEPTLCRLARYCYDLRIEEGTGPSIDVEASQFDPLAPTSGVARLPDSFSKISRMTTRLRSNQFASFTE
jgi:5-methylcytosine-specific restriction protein B